jgi:hypothetical protein
VRKEVVVRTWIILLLVSLPLLAQENLVLPVESPLYGDLEQLRALGAWKGSLEARPISRDAFLRALASAEGYYENRAPSLRLQRLRRQARLWKQEEELHKGDFSRFPSSRWETYLGLQAIGGKSDFLLPLQLDRRTHRNRAFFLGFQSRIGKHLAAEWRLSGDYSSRTPQSCEAGWYDHLPPNLRDAFTDLSARNDRAVLSLGLGRASLRIGREHRHWGTGRHGTLFLSENPYPLDGISFRFETRYLSGVSLFAQTLRGDDPPPLDGSDLPPALPGEAFMAAHRFGIHPPGPLSFGIYEAVVWGGRGLDLGYLNPVGFLVAMTQDIFDRSGSDDKKVLGLDARLDLPPFTLYGEFLLDRLVVLDSALGEKPAASTFGLLGGLCWADPLGLPGARLDLEYAHLDPQLYFHPDSDRRRFLLTEGELIGHWIEPNADNLRIHLEIPRTMGDLGFGYERLRRGFVDGLSGKDAGFFGLLKEDKQWITGEVASESLFSLSWSMRNLKLGHLDCGASFILARVVREGPTAKSGWQMELRLRGIWRKLFLSN